MEFKKLTLYIKRILTRTWSHGKLNGYKMGYLCKIEMPKSKK